MICWEGQLLGLSIFFFFSFHFLGIIIIFYFLISPQNQPQILNSSKPFTRPTLPDANSRVMDKTQKWQKPHQQPQQQIQDRISSLPDAILCHILSFLPTKHAVDIAVLSPRWKYLFTSLTHLDFDDSLHHLPSNKHMIYKVFERLELDFVRKALGIFWRHTIFPNLTRLELGASFVGGWSMLPIVLEEVHGLQYK